MIALPGIAAAAGIAVGPALVLASQKVSYVQRVLRSYEVEEEVSRFHRATLVAREELQTAAERSSASRSELSIIEAYLLMLADETLAAEVDTRIRRDRQCAEWALSLSIKHFSSLLSAQQEPYLRERSRDFDFIGERLLMALTGANSQRELPKIHGKIILVAYDLSPADLIALGRDQLLAIATEVGTRTCHTAIVARALEIPSVLGVEGLLAHVNSGDRLLVDGLCGSVTVRPSDEVASSGQRRGRCRENLSRHLLHDAHRQASLASGETISLLANIEFSHEASLAVTHGAEGVGLYRTEFLYTDRRSLPSEDEQFEQFRSVIHALEGRPLVFRTFDMGGDKPIGNLSLPPQPNPALGLRAARLALEYPDLLLTQLRAMIRASAEGDVRIMVPMVTSMREWREIRKLFDQACHEIDTRHQACAARIPLGIMIEVPSVALLIDHFAPHTEFLSLGTNDLTQYTLAVDRTSPQLSRLASHFDPAVLRLIYGVIRGASTTNRPLTLCGAMAGDPLAAILLVGLGLRSFSMEPAVLPELKEALRRVSLQEAEEAAHEVMMLASAEDVEHLLASQFAHRLIDLLSGASAD